MGQLNFNLEQKQKLKEIHKQFKDKISQNKQAIGWANTELRDRLASTATADQIRNKHDQVLRLRQDLEKLTFESMLATREVLTLQFAQLMERRQNSRNQRKYSLGAQN